MNDNLQDLLKKLQNGTISKEERSILDAWYLKEAASKSSIDVPSALIEEDLKRLAHFNPKRMRKSSASNRYIYWAAAAILLVTLCAGLYYWPGSGTIADNQIAIGGNKATLVLSNGEIVDLEEVDNNERLEKNGVLIQKSDNGTITYTLTGRTSRAEGVDQITTPKGGEFKVVLVDGTKVWLNANSSLKFFTTLGDYERKVSLTGEAYFEVSHDKSRPFIVHALQQDIRVLGTKFNVRALGHESQTTLVEGKVALRQGQVVLRPGQQLTTRDGVDLPVKQVEVESFLAWKDGYFLFNNEPLVEVMEKIAAWYDVEVEYKDNIKEELIWATVSKYRDIKEVLHMIELTGAARFAIEGRRVVVSR
ncbi:FecR family protein [Sphingobacterium sp. SYP-B4668]|uniref:FecR family protein n=1 Tax=Sphingobacterium sp. SYP-B4668 TaxID=2996035 RepID=UPI0022DD1246|nr:FecR family protein [Sphingobacterium sp. SYP-B4668]